MRQYATREVILKMRERRGRRGREAGGRLLDELCEPCDKRLKAALVLSTFSGESHCG